MPELLIEPVWPWPLVLVTSVALIGVVLLTYPQRVAHLPLPWRRTLLGLRLATAVILIFALLRPALRYSETDKQSSQVIVLTDVSRSMTTADGPGGITRRAAVLKGIEGAAAQWKKLGEEVELRFFDFAEELVPVDSPSGVADGKWTSIGHALDELRREENGSRLAGVILFSDGAERSASKEAVDPRTAARRFAEQRGVPIHTLTYGSSELTGAGLDLAIEDVVVDPLAYEKKTVPVRFQFRTRGASGRKAKLRLLLERPTGTITGSATELVELPLSEDARPFEELEINGNQSVQSRELTFVADQPGEYKLVVEAVPLDGEIKLSNNRYETVITVLKGGLKVAYFDVPRSVEQKFVSRLNENARLQIETIFLPGGRLLSQARVDPALFTPGRFDVYIIGDVPASVFRQGGVDLLAQLRDRCLQDRVGLAMLGGINSFGAGGYAGTPIADLIPVQMSPSERVEPGESPPASRFIAGPVQMLPGPDGRTSSVMQLGPNNDELWRSLPPLKNGANKLVPRTAGVAVLAMTAANEPLLLGWDTGSSRVLALGISDSWRWWTHGHASLHQRFWEQFLLWLARMENESDLPVWVRVNPRNSAPGDRVIATFGAQDDQKQPLDDATFALDVTTPDGSRRNFPTQKVGEENLAEISGLTEPGDYLVMVTARRNGTVYGSPARTRFIVDQRDLELDNPAADPGLMAEIATITGAVPIPPENINRFLDELLREGLKSEMTRYSQINLWDGWPLLLVFVGLLTTEWMVRKQRGMV